MNRHLTGGKPSVEKATGLALVTAAAVISSIATIYGLRLCQGSTICSLLTLFYVFIYTRKLQVTSKNTKTMMVVFSAVFSAACIQGALLRIEGETYTGLVKENYMGYFQFKDAAAMIVFSFAVYYLVRLVFPHLYSVGEYLGLRKPEGERLLYVRSSEGSGIPKEKGSTGRRRNALFSKKWKAHRTTKTKSFLQRHRSVLLPMTVLFFFWLPYFIAYYPGFILGDSCSSIRQALGLEEFSNHYPVMYTLFIRLCLRIGKYFGSLTFGCAVYSLIQMIFLAYALSRMIQWLGRRGLPWQLCMLLTIFFGITPFFAQVSIAMWKDPVFSAAILLWTLLLLDHIFFQRIENNEKKMSRFWIDARFLLKNT